LSAAHACCTCAAFHCRGDICVYMHHPCLPVLSLGAPLSPVPHTPHLPPLTQPPAPCPAADVCLGPIVKLWAPAGVQGEKTIVTPFTKKGTYFLVDPGEGHMGAALDVLLLLDVPCMLHGSTYCRAGLRCCAAMLCLLARPRHMWAPQCSRGDSHDCCRWPAAPATNLMHHLAWMQQQTLLAPAPQPSVSLNSH
jgi:hypothetical protein